MADQIYVVDPATQETQKVEPVSFYDIGVTERDDLQRWVVKDPDLLGEPLLLVASEFNRFDKSSRRLDILALDAKGSLVVIELKLDTRGSLADQQAIRYAAFCSTMTIEDVVAAFAKFHGLTREKACERIREFLGVEELPKLGDRPRIILAGGSVEDRELTSCVLWLRGFGMDISCVELTPYRVPGTSQVILAPKTVIPIPEAQDYRVSVERGIEHTQCTAKKLARARFWRSVAEEFNKLGTNLRASGRGSGVHMCVRFGCANIHYEWVARKRDARLDVALHFEFDSREESLRWLEIIKPHVRSIRDGTDLEFEAVLWGRKWTEARFRLPFEGDFPGTELAGQAARIMKILIERTWPLIERRICSEFPVARKRISKASKALLAASQRLEKLRTERLAD